MTVAGVMQGVCLRMRHVRIARLGTQGIMRHIRQIRALTRATPGRHRLCTAGWRAPHSHFNKAVTRGSSKQGATRRMSGWAAVPWCQSLKPSGDVHGAGPSLPEKGRPRAKVLA